MRRLIALSLSLAAAFMGMSCRTHADEDSSEKIIAPERAALDRWGNGDPGGYLEIIAPDETYFDPLLDQRLAGLDVLKKYLAPFTGKIHIDHYEMINPIVQRSGDTAILTFNLVDTGRQPDSDKTTTVRWNSTEVYRLIDGHWKIVHSHWSYTRPELKAGT